MKRITRRRITSAGTVFVLALLLVLASQGAAARPATGPKGQGEAEASGVLAPSSTLISYQGTLTNQTGAPVNTTVTMQFRLYDAASGGNLKWGPETQNVQVTNGLFNVLLGSVAAINPTNLTGDLWLDIKVNSEQLTPRERLTTVPYTTEAGTLTAGALTRGTLQVNGTLWQLSPDSNLYGIRLQRTDEESKQHTWALWHMNQQYGMNAFKIYEYRTDNSGVSCGGNAAEGAMCAPRLTIWPGGDVCIGLPDHYGRRP